MIKATELMIGDWVLVSGTPRRVESITKKKIGYHINPQTDMRLHYARLHDVEPIKVTEVLLKTNNFDIHGFYKDKQYATYRTSIVIEGIDRPLFKPLVTARCNFYSACCFVNGVHSIQQVCRMCGIEINWKL